MERIVHLFSYTLSLCLLIFLCASLENSAFAAEREKRTRTVYPKKTDLDFEGLAIEGEVRNPGEFYFKHRPQERFGSLVQRRKNFHPEMLRDAVMSR